MTAAILWMLSAGFAPTATAQPALADQERLFGLVIGNNRSDRPDTPTLRYADDDAVQNARLLVQMGAKVVLLVEMDQETKLLNPGLQTIPSTQAAVLAAMDTLNQRMDEHRSRGERTVFYLFYSGHGDVENNEGYINLQDARFGHRDFIELIRRSRADTNHVIIDACKSYFLVFSRGAGGERAPVSGPLAKEDPQLPPNTGVFLSTSSAADSHEWEAFGGGVFSHEMRSALRGGADLNGDGELTYEEVAAFIWSANAAIVNRRYQPNFFNQPPQGQPDAKGVLLCLGSAQGHRLSVGPGLDRHAYVENALGQRLADFHPGARVRLTILLPPERPLFVRFFGSDEEVALPEGRELRLAELAVHSSSSLRRGAEHVAFGLLFSRAFDGGSIEAYLKRPAELVEVSEIKTDWTWARWGFGISALVVGATGGAMSGQAYSERHKVHPETSGLERDRINRRIDNYNVAAVTLYAVAGTTLAAFLIWTFWPDEKVEVRILPSPAPQAQMLLRF